MPGDTMTKMASSFKESFSDASSSTRWPASSRLTMEFETALLLEAEEPVRFIGTDILPYFSQRSSRSSSSDFDTQSDSSGSTSFCNLNDSNRITLGSLIGLPMDSFRRFGDSFHFITRVDSQYDSGSNRTIDRPPRRSRSCSLLADIFRCLQRTRTDYINTVTAPRTFNNLSSFTITEVSEEQEQDSDTDTGPTVFENSVFVDRSTLGSRIYEFNPLYISDALSEVDTTEARDLSLRREVPALGTTSSLTPKDSDYKETPKCSSGSSTQSSPQSAYPQFSPDPLPSSNIRSILTTICCRLGDDYLSDSG